MFVSVIFILLLFFFLQLALFPVRKVHFNSLAGLISENLIKILLKARRLYLSITLCFTYCEYRPCNAERHKKRD